MNEGDRLKEVGMATVWANEQDWWKNAAWETACKCLRESGEFSSEDIIAEIGMPPYHPNSVGAIVNGIARKMKLYKARRIKAWRSSRHSGEIAVWKEKGIDE